MNRQQLADQRSREFHKRIALKLRTSPELWKIPEENLRRWMMTYHAPALAEWQQILQTRTKEEILALLESDSEDADRLRSSSPFTRILTQKERLGILQLFKNAEHPASTVS